MKKTITTFFMLICSVFVFAQQADDAATTNKWIETYEKLHKKFADFNFSNGDLEYLDVTNENYQYFHDKAFSGSGLAALKIAQFYENQNAQNIY